MTTSKALVCLANSRKLSGRCVAGIVDGSQGEWIRPVSARRTREVSEPERQYEDGSDPRVLDIVSVPLLRPQPHSFQRENWLLDPDYYWEKVGQVGWNDLCALEQRPGTLWIDGYSTYHGSNDRMPVEQAAALLDSLKLIRVNGVQLHVHAPSELFGNSRRVVDAGFSYAGIRYTLRVTDPDYEYAYLVKSDGFYELGESFITVSLGEPYEDFVYKLVAAIMERAEVEAGDNE